MEKLLQAPTEGYGEAIIISEILAENFEIKTNLLQLVQTNKFHGFERDNPHTHISNFKRMTSTLKYRDVPNDAIKLMLFPYSLKGAVRIWYEKEPPNLILTLDDLETFGEAWERFKEMLRACPHHGFLELTQIHTFYNGLNEQDQDSLNAATGGNLLRKTTREALKIIENKSKVCYSRSKSNVSRVNMNSRESSSKTDDRIDKLADQILNLVKIVHKQVITPATVKAVEKSCVICGGAHNYYDCIATDNNQSSVSAATGTYNQVPSPNQASNQMPPLDFSSMQNIQNRANYQIFFSHTYSFGESDFLLEEIEDFLKDESIPTRIEDSYYDPEGDILYIEKLLNDDLSQLPPMDFKQAEETKEKSCIKEPPEIELKELLSHLEYAFLEEIDKLPVIIAKDLKDVEKEALLKVLKSHKRAIAWKIIDIKGINPRFYTHKILMVEDYKPMVQSQRGVNLKIHEFVIVFTTNDYKDCVNAFETLKKKLTKALILVVPNWNLPFERMCDASDFAIGAVLEQHHPALKYLLSKQDAKPGLLRAIISDRGTHFCNDQFAKVMTKYEVTHRLATTYHPQTSGQVKVSNRGLKRILKRTVGENHASWSDKLDDALWAFRTAFKTPIGCTPYKLVYGKSCLNEINKLHFQAYENSLIYKERTKKLHDSKSKNPIFNVGDQVLLFNSHLKIFSGMLKTRWLGPFTITQVFPYGTVELSQPDGLNFKVNVHRVKHYFRGDIPSKVVLDLHTIPIEK
uniref:Reverse transcriptase domain-containing protein n=1 Tax=Tanacetum cinerariifolium TaxID=118510 RepID=A0A6L2J227_TANCI|nr:reverse transcriptase domain-containing protein [Tanacetum cinerariifolium]